jgi:hypothetical protein
MRSREWGGAKIRRADRPQWVEINSANFQKPIRLAKGTSTSFSESIALCTVPLRRAKVRGASLAGSHMVSINKELEAAKAAKAAINSLSTTPLSKSVFLAALNKANHAAILNLSSGGALNEARGNVGIALSNLMYSPRTLEKIDKAKRAIEAWIRELETAKPAA